jgi:hypothetical protein
MSRPASADDVGTSWGINVADAAEKQALVEVITDAWATRAPKSLVRKYREHG